MAEIGGKLHGLNALQSKGFQVPSFVGIPADASLDEVRHAVREMFDTQSLLAVRSSAAVEDGAEKSYAGAFKTALGIPADDIDYAWKEVCDSMPASRPNEVILQEFVNGSVSGVCFADSKSQRATMNYLPGLCAAVVQGFDAHHIEFNGKRVELHVLVSNPRGIFFEQGQLITKEDQTEISETLLQKVSERCLEVSRQMGAVVDIEWTVRDGVIYMLQARPVTRDIWKNEAVQIFDSANVGESYGGIVLPLTIGFAKKLYSQVYRDLLLHSAVPEEKLKRYKTSFDGLVDEAFGRIYYRMENWYAFLSMLPGYERNKSNLEHMLLLEQTDHQHQNDLKPSWWLWFIYYPLVLWKLLWFKRTMRTFEAEVKKVLEEASHWPIENYDHQAVRARIAELFGGILRKWYLTVENDTVVMSLYASLSKEKSPKEIQALLGFHSISVDQINALAALSVELHAIPELADALKNTDQAAFKKSLKENQRQEVAYRQYLRQYGGRFANELKLETADISDDFEAFARMMILYRAKEKPEASSSFGMAKRSFLEKVFQRFAARREVFRLYRASMFAVVRKLVMRLADLEVKARRLEQRSDIFYLDWDDLSKLEELELSKKVEERKAAYRHYEQLDPPTFFKVVNGRWPKLDSMREGDFILSGMGASSGKVSGKAHVMKSFQMPTSDSIDILITERTDPGWTAVMALSKGLIVEHGGMLSHASIVARELGIPAVIGIKGACRHLKNGQKIFLDGDAGIVTLLEQNE